MLGGKNKHPRQPLGYTIIEIMIVLAVSGFMFVIAATFINGKQEKAAFAQGSGDMVSNLQQTVEDITDGHYSDVPLQCGTAGGSFGASTSSSGSQGSQSDCVFLGKIVRFYDPSGGANRDHYSVYSVAASRTITSFPNSLVAAIQGLTSQSTVPQSLIVKKMSVIDTGGASHTNVYNVGFMQGLGNIDVTTGTYLSGAQQPIQLVYANTTSGSEGAIAGNIIRPAKSATICLTNGLVANSRYAEIFIGGPTVGGRQSSSSNNNQLNISVQQLGTTSC
ncbi:MAG TPA: hypothetical protein VHA05_01345 [Candidatus Saccharimonadales bacterium]|nr:hypothetical protein [Candidatus Saccharimonadales bacterium]